MHNKCCIVGCGSKRSDINLYRFPKCKIGIKKWLQFINCDKLRSLSLQELHKSFLCKRHFEKRFLSLNSSRSRLRVGAYPTLFTNMEITSGVPENATNDRDAKDLIRSEHDYFKKKHEDHSYVERTPMVENEFSFLPSQRNDNMHHKSSHEVAISISGNLQIENSTTETDSIDVVIDYEVIDPPELEDSMDGPFTWQKQAITCADDDNINDIGDEPEPIHEAGNSQNEQSMIVDLETVVESEGEEQEHEGYRCNECAGDIIGFRYVCVQCSDYDVCAACEARGAHRRHYALRVPPRKPRGEVQRVIEAIQKFINDDPSFIFLPADDSVKIEIKNEDEEQSNETECESDPLMVPTAQSLPEEETIRQVPVLEQGPLHLSNTEHINKQPVFNSSSVPDTGQDYREVYYLSSDEPESILSRTKVDGQNCLVDDNNPTNSVKESDEQNNLVLLRNATPETESNVKLKLTNATNYLTKDLSGQTCVKSKNLLVKLNRLDMSKLGVLSERRLKNIKKTSTFKR